MRLSTAPVRTGPRPSTVLLVFILVWLLMELLALPTPVARPAPTRADTISREIPPLSLQPGHGPLLAMVAASDTIRLDRMGVTLWICDKPFPEPLVSAWIHGTVNGFLMAAHEIKHARDAWPRGCRGANAVWEDPVLAAADEAAAYCAMAEVGVSLGVWEDLDAAITPIAAMLDTARIYSGLRLGRRDARRLLDAACATPTS